MKLGMGHAVPGIETVAVIGGGAAGLFAASLLDGTYRVTLIEKGRSPGGHACSVIVPEGPDAGTALDVGFVNCARSAYPRLYAYFAHLGIETAPSDSSFCVFDERNGNELYFAMGAQGRAQAERIPDPRTFRYFNKIARFYARAAEDLAAGRLRGLTVGDYCRQAGLDDEAVENFIAPVYASLWVMPPRDALSLSAESVYSFYRRVGLPSFSDYDAQYVVGSSRRYVDALVRGFGGTIRTQRAISRLTRAADGVELVHADGSRERFDAAVVALHADDALALIEDPSEDERRLLGAWRYPSCRTVLHTDPSVIPAGQSHVVAYNYRGRAAPRDMDRLSISYSLNRIMRLEAQEHYFVSINPASDIDEGRILLEADWSHAFFSVEAASTQPLLGLLQGRRRTYFCGSYFSCGSHEDAVTSAEAACRALGVHSRLTSQGAGS